MLDLTRIILLGEIETIIFRIEELMGREKLAMTPTKTKPNQG